MIIFRLGVFKQAAASRNPLGVCTNGDGLKKTSTKNEGRGGGGHFRLSAFNKLLDNIIETRRDMYEGPDENA